MAELEWKTGCIWWKRCSFQEVKAYRGCQLLTFVQATEVGGLFILEPYYAVQS